MHYLVAALKNCALQTPKARQRLKNKITSAKDKSKSFDE